MDLDIILGFTKCMHECMSILAKTAQKKSTNLKLNLLKASAARNMLYVRRSRSSGAARRTRSCRALCYQQQRRRDGRRAWEAESPSAGGKSHFSHSRSKQPPLLPVSPSLASSSTRPHRCIRPCPNSSFHFSNVPS